MRNDSIFMLVGSVLGTMAIIGGLLYYDSTQVEPRLSAEETVVSAEGPDEIDFYFNPSARTNQIIECNDPELGTFYTNAAACDGADLENRLSSAQTLPRSIVRDLAIKKRQVRSSSSGRSPVLEDPPANLPAECRFPIGKALETEGRMLIAKDPYDSMWRETYCRFRCETLEHKCPVTDKHFTWSYRSMCGSLRPPYCSG